MTAHKYYGIALEYARRGFAALIVMRRGYGTSPGGRVDSVGGCANAAYLPAAAVAVADLRAAIDAMARRADVTTSGMIAAGHSAGGFATVALTAQAPRVSSPRSALPAAAARATTTRRLQSEDGLVQAFATFGKTSRVPMLWVYATNDSYFGPDLARRLYDGFRASGGNAKFIAAPPYGDDGHYLYSVVSRPQWTPYLDAFLRERGLGHDILSPPDPLPPPGQLNEAARAEFARYLASTMPHKAFAVSPNGGYGWRSGRDDRGRSPTRFTRRLHEMVARPARSMRSTTNWPGLRQAHQPTRARGRDSLIAPLAARAVRAGPHPGPPENRLLTRKI